MIKYIGENDIFTKKKTTEELSDAFREKLLCEMHMCNLHGRNTAQARYIRLPATCTLILHLKLTLKYTFETDT